MNAGIVWVLISALVLSACQSMQTRHGQNPQNPNSNPPVVFAPTPTASENIPGVSPNQNSGVVTTNPQSPIEIPEIPKIGLILGPGGARAFAHIAVLQELQREKIPIQSVGGLEFGAPMAALYAWKGFANDVEWQMMKLKTESLQKGHADPGQGTAFLNLVYQKEKVEELKLPFACLAHNTQKNQIYVMSRGPLAQLIPYCWPYPPVMKAYSQNVAGLRDPKLLADHLRQQGANYIVYVNVLAGGSARKPFVGEADSLENLVWQETATSLAKTPVGIDYVLNLNLENYGILEFDKKREILQKGTELSQKAVQQLAKKLNL